MKLTYLILLAALAATSLFGQTKVSPRQLASEATGDPRIFMQLEDGRLVFVRLDPTTLELVPGVGTQPPTLRAKPATSPWVTKTWFKDKVKLTSGAKTITLRYTPSGAFLVYRNGVLQDPEEGDYTQAGLVLTFPQAVDGDLLTVRYEAVP